MSIKLSIKDLKDLLKVNKQAIKKKRRRRNKRLIKNSNDINYNKSSSDHMKSIGFTNTSNEATELIRLQRQALEDKLKNDKEDKIKRDNDQLKADKEGGLVAYDPLKNAGGSNNMRNIDQLEKNVKYLLIHNNYNQYAQREGPLTFPARGSVPSGEPKNAINEVLPEEGPANIKTGGFDDEPTSPLNTNPKVEEIDEVEEKPFDPSKINITYANKGQLLGYILHFDKTQSENASIDMKASELRTIANNIKKSLLLKAEAEEARLQAQIDAKAKAQLAAEAKKDIEEAKIARAKAKIISDEADVVKSVKIKAAAEAAIKANKKAEAVETAKINAAKEAAAKIKADEEEAAKIKADKRAAKAAKKKADEEAVEAKIKADKAAAEKKKADEEAFIKEAEAKIKADKKAAAKIKADKKAAKKG